MTPVVWASLQLTSSRNSMRPLEVVLGISVRGGFASEKHQSVSSEKERVFSFTIRYKRIILSELLLMIKIQQWEW